MRARTMVRRGVGVALAAVLSGALGAGQQASAADPVRYVDEMFDVTVTKDVKYGAAVNSKGQTQELVVDIYEPVDDDADDRGLLIWAHGSGFRVGSKNNAGPVEDYVSRGWVGMSMSYRLRPELPPNAIVGILTNPLSLPTAQAAARDAQHDMQAAVRWARANHETLGIDPDRIAVGGISAGGIIALMTAFNADDPGNSGTPGVSSAVAAAVSHAGAYVPGLQGDPPSAGAPPVAMYHGTSDEQVPFPTSPPGCLLTLLVGNDCEYVAFVGREHATLGVDLARDFLYRHVIVGGSELRFPTVAEVTEDVTALAGVEHLAGDLGVTAGVVVPTDPNVIVEHTVAMVEYVLGGLGVPLALSPWA